MIGSDLGYCCFVPDDDDVDDVTAVAAAAKGASSVEREAGSIWMEGTLRGGAAIENSG